MEWVEYNGQDFPDVDGIVLVEVHAYHTMYATWDREFYAVSFIGEDGYMKGYCGDCIAYAWCDIERFCIVPVT